MKKKITYIVLMAVALFNMAASAFADDIVVYSARKEHLIRPLFETYTKETGVKIKYITDKAPVLMQRIKAEGKNTAADLLITVDAGNLWHAAREGLLQPVHSDMLIRNIPEHLRDSENRWFGLSVRARTIVYNPHKVRAQDLSTYEDLASPQWKKRLLLRTSKKVYNQSLVAMLMAEHGRERAEKIVQGWVDNLAAPPFSNDTDVMKAIAAGQGDVGIVNTYYFGRLIKDKPSYPLALFWPDQNAGGVHVNVSGAGVTTHAKNREAAVKLLEWLSSKQAQNLFADSNLEYPVNLGVEAHQEVAAWGRFKQSLLPLTNAGELQAEAIRLMDRVGYK